MHYTLENLQTKIKYGQKYKKNLEKQIKVKETLDANNMKINKKHQEEEDKQNLEIEEAVESFVVPENELRIFRY